MIRIDLITNTLSEPSHSEIVLQEYSCEPFILSPAKNQISGEHRGYVSHHDLGQ